jgi:hypothetical protein
MAAAATLLFSLASTLKSATRASNLFAKSSKLAILMLLGNMFYVGVIEPTYEIYQILKHITSKFVVLSVIPNCAPLYR